MKRRIFTVKSFITPLLLIIAAICFVLWIFSISKTARAGTGVIFVLNENAENQEENTYSDMAEGWAAAVACSQNNIKVTVLLESEWNLNIDENDNEPQSIEVPQGANILLNLNGCNINFNNNSGSVFTVFGALEITDGNETKQDEQGELLKGAVTGGNAENGGGVYVGAGGVFTLSGGNISNNVAENGGGVYVGENGRFVLSDGNIYENSAGQYGGGVCVAGGGFEMSGGGICRNTVNPSYEYNISAGGGVCVMGINYSTVGGSFVMSDGSIFENTVDLEYSEAECYGGGVAVLDRFSSFVFTRGEVFSNTATKGGGVYVYSGELTTEEDAGIYGNTATDGGGIYVLAGTFNMNGGTLSKGDVESVGGNTANNGGGIYAKSAKVRISDGSVTYNSAVNGAGIYAEKSDLIMYGGSVTENAYTPEAEQPVESNGGGLYLDGGTAEIKGGSISNNSAIVGGGIYSSGTLTVDGGKINENKFGSFGGGIYSSGTLTVNGGTLNGNTEGSDGGGIYSNGTLTVNGGKISQNGATRCGGGIYSEQTLIMNGGAVTENVAEDAGGVYALQGLSVKGLVRIIDNTAPDGAENLYLENSVESGVIKITGKIETFDEPEKGFKIGVSLSDYSKDFTSGYAENCSSEDGYALDASDFFVCDGAAYNSVACTRNGELRMVENKVSWLVYYDDGSEVTVYDSGVSFVYGTRIISSVTVKIGDDEEEVFSNSEGWVNVDDSNQTINYGDYQFKIIITPAKLKAEFTDEAINPYNNHIVVDNFDGSPVTPKFKITTEEAPDRVINVPDDMTLGDAGIYSNDDFTVRYEDNTTLGEATVTITPKTDNFTDEELVLTFFIENSEKPVVSYTGLTWQLKNGENWDDGLTYNGDDFSSLIQAVFTLDDGTSQTVEQGNRDWQFTFTDGAGNVVEELRFADSYGIEIAPVNGQNVTVTDLTTIFKINPQLLTDISAETFGSNGNDSDMSAWLLNVGGNSIKFSDGSQVSYVVKDGEAFRTVRGEDGVAYVYYREGYSLENLITLNVLYNDIGYYLNGFDAYNGTSSVTVGYTNVTSDIDKYSVGNVTTTAKVTFKNYVFSDGKNYLSVSKNWKIVTAANSLMPFDDAYVEITNLPEKYVWEYGDVHDGQYNSVNSGFLTYAFRPVYGGIAEYEIVNEATGEVKAAFQARFAGGIISFWVDGQRVKDKYYLYDYFEELNAGEYAVNVTVPEFISDGSNIKWWEDGASVADNGVLYAEHSYSFKVRITAYTLPENIEDVTDGSFTVSYTNQIAYDATEENNVPSVSVYFKGNKVSASEYTVEREEEYQNVNTGYARFTIIAEDGGNFNGAVKGLPFTIKEGDNAFESLGIISWNYQSFDDKINLITAKPAAGEVTLRIYANNALKIDDDTVIDRPDETNCVLEIGAVQTDAYGTVVYTDNIIESLKRLPAETYWLIAVAEDENGIYGSAKSQIKFVIFPAENSWKVLPNLSGWKYGEYDKDVNVISGAPLYGEATFSIYKEADNRYTLLELNGKTAFTLKEGVPDDLAKLQTGTYYICAVVASTKNYSGFNENFTQADIANFPSFSVFALYNSWKVLPNVVSWKYGSYDSSVNVVTGTPTYGEATFSIYSADGGKFTLLDFGGKSTFVLNEDGSIDKEISDKLSSLPAGAYYLRALVPHNENYSGLHEDDSDITGFSLFNVYKYESFWTETPNLPSWKWKEYDPSVNVISASSSSEEEKVNLKISYVSNGKIIYLTFGDDKQEFTLVDGKVPENVSDVLAELNAGITYTLSAYVKESKNYTSLPTATATFEVIRQTNFWETTPDLTSWKYGEYDRQANAVNGKPAFGESALFSIYKHNGGEFTLVDFGGKTSFIVDADGSVAKEVSDKLALLDAGLYYLRAFVAGTENYTGLDAEESDVTKFAPFNVIQTNNYWQVLPGIASWKYGEYDGKTNTVMGKPAYGGQASFGIYGLSNGKYTLLDFDGKTTFTFNSDGSIPDAVSAKLASLNAGEYYLRATVAATQNYTGLNVDETDVTKFSQFSVIKVNNYWQETPKLVSWRYGEYDAKENAISALPAYGDGVVFSVYGLADGKYSPVEFDGKTSFTLINGEVPSAVAQKLINLDAGTYYLCATVAGTVNYTGLNESVDDVTKLSPFSVIKVRNEWADGNVPSVVGWREGHFNAQINAISGTAKHGEVVFTVTDGDGNEMDIASLGSLKVGSYRLNAYVAGTENYFELSASTTFAVFEDSVGMAGLIAATVTFSVLAVVLAVIAILLLLRRNKKIEEEFRRIVNSELGVE